MTFLNPGVSSEWCNTRYFPVTTATPDHARWCKHSPFIEGTQKNGDIYGPGSKKQPFVSAAGEEATCGPCVPYPGAPTPRTGVNWAAD